MTLTGKARFPISRDEVLLPLCLKAAVRVRLVSTAGTASEEGVRQLAHILESWLQVELLEHVDRLAVGSDPVNSNGGETPITCDVIEIIPPLSESHRQRWTKRPRKIGFELGAQKWPRTRYIPSRPRR